MSYVEMRVASIKRQDWPEHHPPMFSPLAVSIVLNLDNGFIVKEN
jgi:hypothetical protein